MKGELTETIRKLERVEECKLSKEIEKSRKVRNTLIMLAVYGALQPILYIGAQAEMALHERIGGKEYAIENAERKFKVMGPIRKVLSPGYFIGLEKYLEVKE